MRVTIVTTWFPTGRSPGLGVFVARHAASRTRPTEPADADAHPYGDGNAAARVVQALTEHLPG